MKDLVLKKIYKRALLISFLIIGISFFLFDEPIIIIQGYVFGAIISVLGFILMENSIKRAVKMDPGRASRHTMFHYLLRYLIYTMVLIIAVTADYLNFPSTVLGLLIVKITILLSTFFDKNFMK